MAPRPCPTWALGGSGTCPELWVEEAVLCEHLCVPDLLCCRSLRTLDLKGTVAQGGGWAVRGSLSAAQSGTGEGRVTPRAAQPTCPPELQRYIDGALSNNLPFADCPSTITVSPFPGTVDICPQSSSASLHELSVFNTNFQISTMNLFRGFMSIVPPKPEVGAVPQDVRDWTWPCPMLQAPCL